MSTIKHYLKSCRELACFCSQDGFIDNDSLRYTVIIEATNEIVVDIEFDELLMEGSGSLGRRIPCCGQLHLFLDRFGKITRAEVL